MVAGQNLSETPQKPCLISGCPHIFRLSASPFRIAICQLEKDQPVIDR
jgi:hypothetical protein